LLRVTDYRRPEGKTIAFSPTWVIGGALVTIVFIFVLSPGIRL